ncbi:hypothetical protein RHGRI_036575 [Rhododendron griersonianum]|uniref:Uncharacterized protein n=1 Tax=Rhododendron griersonianum TaxID=479676 RepID=A0AAV6HPJ2_9ERIC|nr:hypothetical protein RHGRI_036575 [Rhododendron griersonianum]
MAKVGANSKKQENGVSLKLKTVVEMHQKSLDHLLPFSTTDDNNVPEDVKQGYFAVIAEDDYELKRFVIPLTYLIHPSFLQEAIYWSKQPKCRGFYGEGALTLPCSPRELERILDEELEKDR